MSLERTLKTVKRHPTSLIFAIAGSLILLFTIFTLFNMVFRQLVLEPGNLVKAISDPTVLSSIGLTLYAALLATVIATILGTPLAYVLARHSFHGKNIVESLVDVPLVIPHTVAGIALYGLLMSKGAVGTAFSNLGVVFEDSLWGIVAAMFFVGAPFFVNAAREGFQSIDPTTERVARTLGANQWQAFYRISLPLALSHIFSGAIMSWARGVSEFGAVIFIAFYPMIAPTLIYYRFASHGLPAAQPVAVLLIIICFAIFMVLRVSIKRWRRHNARP